jgi:hypothetical protein
MSGPTTALFLSSDPLSILLSAALIRAQAAIVNAHLTAEQLADRNEETLQNRICTFSDESTSYEHQLQQALLQAENNYAELIALANQIGCEAQIGCARPVRPETEDAEALTTYVQALQALNQQCKPVLLAEAARRAEQLHEGTETTLASTAQQQIPRRIADRLLQRIAHLGDIPEPLQQLAQQLSLALPGPHADMLATELRLQSTATAGCRIAASGAGSTGRHHRAESERSWLSGRRNPRNPVCGRRCRAFPSQ